MIKLIRKDFQVDYIEMPKRSKREARSEKRKNSSLLFALRATAFNFVRNKSKRVAWLIPAALFCACLMARVLFVAPYLEGWDSVNFALALRDFDITAGQPHFPGYPVYIFFGRIFLRLVGDVPLALTLTGAIFGSLTILPLYGLAKKMFTRSVAVMASLLFIVNPLLWLQAEKAYSDTFGLFFIMLWTYLLYRALSQEKYVYFAGLLLGLALGVRLSYFPFLLSGVIATVFLVHERRQRRTLDGLYGLLLGLALWLVPLLLTTGFGNLWTQGLRHVHGHFHEWGGSLVTSTDLGARLQMFLWDLLANGLGFWWPDASIVRLIPLAVIVAALILWAVQTRFDANVKFILGYLAPYVIWVFAGQNLNSPRHVLPLLPMLLIVVAAGIWQGLERFSKDLRVTKLMRLSASALLLGATALTATALVRQHRNTAPTRVQLVRYVVQHFPKETTVVYCWNTKRLFDYYGPEIHTRSTSIDKLRFRYIAATGVETVLVTSDYPGVEQLKDKLVLLKTFKRNRYVHNWFHDLRLYRLKEIETKVVNGGKTL